MIIPLNDELSLFKIQHIQIKIFMIASIMIVRKTIEEVSF